MRLDGTCCNALVLRSLSLKIEDGRIEAARFLAYGCPPTLACGSAITDLIEGMSLEQARALTREQLVKAVGGLPTRKHHAAALAIETLNSALDSKPLKNSF